MAEMVPDRLPSRASKGEERVFGLLKNLPDDYVVYYEPIIENRYPDFIVIAPDLGILVIEVKGWYPRDVISADNNLVVVKEEGSQVRRAHPVRQAREYMFSLMDQCRRITGKSLLINESGEHKGKFIFPFGHFAVLSNINKEQLESLKLSTVFDDSKHVTRDKLMHWCDLGLAGQDLVKMVKQYFDPFWPIERMSDPMIAALRGCIHPEILISHTEDIDHSESKVSNFDLKVLDIRQEKNARRIGDGHRIIEGVAGSGKTCLLISRVKLIAEQRPKDNLLILCFNRSLASYLKKILNTYQERVIVTHFDGFAKDCGITRRRKNQGGNQLEDNQSLGIRLLEALRLGNNHNSHKFDAVFIDEAQDFEPNWFSCVLEAMKDPNDGDLLIVADGNQGIYKREGIRWKDLGISAQGRTIGKNFDLDKNYRNTKEIMEVANLFSSENSSLSNGADDIRALKTDLSQCRRSNNIKPTFINASSSEEEDQAISRSIKSLLDGKWFGQDIEPLKPNEIGVLYPSIDKGRMTMLLDSIKDIAPVLWLKDPKNRRNEEVDFNGIRIQTIHSSKGLQFKAVFVIWSDKLPQDWGEKDEERDQRLLYVALTRPEEYLVITASNTSSFVEKISGSDKVNCF